MNVAYIDSANLHFGTTASGFELDYARFRVWLKDKFGIEKAYLFLGNIPKYGKLYEYFQECGFTLIFKEVTNVKIYYLDDQRDVLKKEKTPERD